MMTAVTDTPVEVERAESTYEASVVTLRAALLAADAAVLACEERLSQARANQAAVRRSLKALDVEIGEAPGGLSYIEQALVALVKLGGTASKAQIKVEMGLVGPEARSRLTHACGGAEERGWAVRTGERKDRSIVLRVTPEGRKAARALAG